VIAGSFGVFAEAEDDPKGNFLSGAVYEFSRTGAGWTARSLTPSASQFAEDFSPAPGLLSSDFGTMTWMLNKPAQPTRHRDLYLRRSDGSLELVGPVTPPEAVGVDAAFLAGGSRDLSHVLFSLATDRWPGDTTAKFGEASLYESVVGATAPEPKLVGVKNSGALASNLEAQLIGQCGTKLGRPQEAAPSRAVSANGESVVFTVLGRRTGGCGSLLASIETCEAEGHTRKECEEREGLMPLAPEVSEVYARVGMSKTVAISEPSPPQCSSAMCIKAAEGERRDGTFQSTSEDGAKVFFTTAQPLLDSDTDTSSDLYEAEISSTGIQRLIQVSRGDSSDPTQGSGARVLSVPAVSGDGSRAYLVAEGVLTTATNQLGQGAVGNAPNLYMVEPASGRTTFVTTLASSEVETPRATPDGRFLVFGSSQELFKYDSQTGALVSVAPEATTWLVSTDGSYVFFDSTADLVPGALNDPTHTRNNVYEYHNGQISLISDGRDVHGEGATLTGSDASGANVFFETVDALVSQDTDTETDIYDARIGGGFPAVPSRATCSGDGCQGPSTAPPPPLVAGSATQAGGGNLVAAQSKPPNSVPRHKVAKKKRRHAKHKRGRSAGRQRRAHGR
jgi:hypothetical protein